MADQGRWFKLWCSAATDPDLSNLSLEDFARWCLVGVYLKEHGDEGKVILRPPATALRRQLRLPSFTALVDAFRRFPNCILATGPITWPHGHDKPPVIRGDVLSMGGVATPEWLGAERGGPRGDARSHVTIDHVTELHVCWQNWRKYQEDSSAARTRIWRERKRGERDGRRDDAVTTLEEKRREENKPPISPVPPNGPPSARQRVRPLRGMASPGAPVADGFDRFWSLLPAARRKNKADARKAWDAVRPDAALTETILGALQDQLASPDLAREDFRFFPHPHRWLAKRRWDDDASRMTPTNPYAGWPTLHDCGACERGCHDTLDQRDACRAQRGLPALPR
jgi:hypothetical protein